MKMKVKMRLFMLSFFGGALLLGTYCMLLLERESITDNQFILSALIWFVCFASTQFFIFRCPTCKKLAIFTRRGGAMLFVGNECRYCGKAY
jgi:hypothetical protein